jgi:hypothetical protein
MAGWSDREAATKATCHARCRQSSTPRAIRPASNKVENSLPSLMKCEFDCVVVDVGITRAQIFERVAAVARHANYFPFVSVGLSVGGIDTDVTVCGQSVDESRKHGLQSGCFDAEGGTESLVVLVGANAIIPSS